MATTLAPQARSGSQTTEILVALASLIRSARSIARQHHQKLGASGTPVAVLKSLAHNPGQDRPGDLAQAAGVAPSVMSRVLARLEEDGLVTRRRDQVDARACHIALTPTGQSQLVSIEREYAEILDAALVDLPAEELARMPVLLRTLEEALVHAVTAVPAQRPALAPSLSSALGAPHLLDPIHESR